MPSCPCHQTRTQQPRVIVFSGNMEFDLSGIHPAGMSSSNCCWIIWCNSGTTGPRRYFRDKHRTLRACNRAHRKIFRINIQQIRDAIDLYQCRIPVDQQVPRENIVDMVRGHLRGDFANWQIHFLCARFNGRVVGMLIAYENTGANFVFVSYLAARTPRFRGKKPDYVSGALGNALLEQRQSRGLRSQRFLFEVEDPALSANLKERNRNVSRIRLFDHSAPFQGLHLRVLDIRYLQPDLDWPKGDGERELLLCYAAPSGLPDDADQKKRPLKPPRTYTELYGDDVYEDTSKRSEYARYTRGLLDSAVQKLPETIRLLRYQDLNERRVD